MLLNENFVYPEASFLTFAEISVAESTFVSAIIFCIKIQNAGKSKNNPPVSSNNHYCNEAFLCRRHVMKEALL